MARKHYKISVFGIHYEIPAVRETIPFIRVLQGETDPWKGSYSRSEWKRKRLAENGMRRIIMMLLGQVQRTVGHQVETMLTQEISEKMRPIIFQRVMDEMEERQKLLTDGEEGEGAEGRP